MVLDFLGDVRSNPTIDIDKSVLVIEEVSVQKVESDEKKGALVDDAKVLW